MQHQPSMKQIMAIMAERDAAIHERNVSLSEKKTALAERDMAMLQRDSAIAERDNAIIERDNAIDYAIATFQYRENLTNDCNIAPCPPGSQIAHVHPQSHHEGEASYGSREMPMNDAVSVSPVSSEPAKPRKTKRAKEVKPTKRSSRKLKKEVEETTPVPVCSCTGVFRSCYKWGNSGWQSSCCTTNLSIYPLPAHPIKRHARIGRKMSRSAFNKLLNRLAAEGHDHSNPVDLKEHWAKHGTNRYISIK